METNGNLRRELLIMALTAIVTAIGWGFIDRLHWAGNEKQIEINTGKIKDFDARLAVIPEHPVSQDQLNGLEKLITTQHSEMREMMLHLEGRVDYLAAHLPVREMNKEK